MKVLILILMMSFYPIEPDYCSGWKGGYVQGWCHNIENCITPIVPICPLPSIGQDTYQNGYNDGFLKGRRDRTISSN